MPSLNDILKGDLDQIIDEWRSELTINNSGIIIPCIKTKLDHEQIFTIYGFDDSYKCSVRINYNNVETIPDKGTKVTLDGENLEVISDEANGTDFILHLKTAVL